ncbi:hypothetical protein [Aliivibrio logei]|jgi:hypothetical protein
MNILLPSTTTRKMDNMTQHVSAEFSEEQFLTADKLEEATFISMKPS